MAMKRKMMWLLSGALLLGSTVLALAPSSVESSILNASYDLSWWTLDGGGYTFSTGGSYSLGGTIGQPDAGPTFSNGGYSLTGGFWSGVAALERYPVYLPLVVRSAQ
jgi:hypothetical protein